MNVRNVKPQIDSYFMHVTCDKSYFSSTKSTQIITPFFVGKKEEGKKTFMASHMTLAEKFRRHDLTKMKASSSSSQLVNPVGGLLLNPNMPKLSQGRKKSYLVALVVVVEPYLMMFVGSEQKKKTLTNRTYRCAVCTFFHYLSV